MQRYAWIVNNHVITMEVRHPDTFDLSLNDFPKVKYRVQLAFEPKCSDSQYNACSVQLSCTLWSVYYYLGYGVSIVKVWYPLGMPVGKVEEICNENSTRHLQNPIDFNIKSCLS